MNKTHVMVGFVILVAIVGGWIMMMRQQSQQSAQPTTEAQNDTMEVTEDDRSTQTITMEAGSFYYSVKEIRAKKGDTIKIVMTAKDMQHDFTLDEFNVKSPIVKAGESVTIEFVADLVGTFTYYCDVGQHRKMGQIGTLIVE